MSEHGTSPCMEFVVAMRNVMLHVVCICAKIFDTFCTIMKKKKAWKSKGRQAVRRICDYFKYFKIMCFSDMYFNQFFASLSLYQ